MTNAEYHGDTSRVSKSGLDQINRSPAHYWQRYLNPNREPEVQSPALLLGSAFHSAVLEPEDFSASYIRAIECDRRTKEGKKAWEDFMSIQDGKTAVNAGEFDKLLAMRKAIQAHPIASALLEDGTAEGTLHFTHAGTGVACKSRLDFLHSSGEYIIDLKTTEDASPAAFFKSVANYRYHVQGAFYLDAFAYAGLKAPDKFVFIAVEKSPPYGVGVYYLPEDVLAIGRECYEENLATYAEAISSGIWTGYTPEKILPVTLPAWALNKL